MRRTCTIALGILTVGTVVLGTLGVSAAPAGAATVTVCAVGCDHASVSAAVAAANAGDEITVGPGTYSEPASILINKALTIVGAGSASTIIDGGATPVGQAGQIQIRTGSGEDVTIEGITIRNPVVSGTTAAVLAKSLATPGPTYVLDDVRIEGNGSGDEYGLWTDNSTAHITFSNGSISGTNFNPVLIEQPRGDSTIENSTIARGVVGGGFFSMTSNPNGNGLGAEGIQTISGSSFTGGAGASFVADFSQNGAGGYDDIRVLDNTFEGVTGSGVRIHNNAPDGNGAVNDYALVTGNTITGASPTSTGIQISGLSNQYRIASNDLSGLGTGIDLLANPSGGVGSHFWTVESNRIVSNTVGLRTTGLDASKVTVFYNWWGCNAGPGAAGCDTALGDATFLEQLALFLDGPTSVSYPDLATFTASILDVNGVPAGDQLAGLPVAFGATAGSITPSVALSSSQADAELTPPALNGPITISATLDNETVTLDTEIVGAPLIPTQLTPSALVLDTVPILRLSVADVTARLTEAATGVPVPGQTVQFTAGATFLCQAVTNANGVAKCRFPLQGLLAGVLNLGYTASYAGDLNHAPSGGAVAGRGPLIRIGGLRLF